MSIHRVERFIERFINMAKLCRDGRMTDEVTAIHLRRELLPLLEAGQMQRNRHCGPQGIICAACKAWDTAIEVDRGSK